MRIIKFRTSCNGWGALLNLIKHYKDDAYNNKEHDNDYTIIEKGDCDKERPHNKFEMFTKKQIKQHKVLAKNKEHTPDHKYIRDFLNRITDPEMGVRKAAIAASLGPTFTTLEMVVTLLSHFISQKNRAVLFPGWKDARIGVT